MTMKYPSIDIPILSGAAAFALHVYSGTATSLVGVYYPTTLPVPAVGTMNMTDPGTRKRTVAEASATSVVPWSVCSLPPVAAREVGIEVTVPDAAKAGVPMVQSAVHYAKTLLP